MLTWPGFSGHVPLQRCLPGRCYTWYGPPFVLVLYTVQLTRPSACLPHYTAGQTYFYPAFNARTEDARKFAHEFGEVLAQPIMLEAVMRVRASKSMPIADLVQYLETYVILFNIRSAHVFVPRQFLRTIYGSSGNARCAPRSLVRYRGSDRGHDHGSVRCLPDCRPAHELLW